MHFSLPSDDVFAAVPANLTIPTLDPLPERVEFIEDEIEDVVLDLANQTQAVDLIELKVGGIEVLINILYTSLNWLFE